MFSINNLGFYVCLFAIGLELGFAQQKTLQKCDEFIRKKCIHNSRVKRVIGGSNVDHVITYPHQALIGFSDGVEITWACGGALIDEQWVLTAAKCLKHKRHGPATYVDIGFVNRENRNDFGTLQSFKVIERIGHPDYVENSPYHDIALLKLDRPALLSRSVFPACIHDTFNVPHTDAVACGWGVTSNGASKGSEDLLEVVVPLIDANKCNNMYRSNRLFRNGIIDKQHICAGETNRDTCQGDAGGPLLNFHRDSCMHCVIGVASFSENCGAKPSVYTRVSNYLPWIENILWP